MAGGSKKEIWYAFFILSAITIVEVALGIIKPEFMIELSFITTLLNWTFIILTVLKAYYIVWFFMHVKHENKGFRMSITVPMYIIVLYTVFIFMMESYFTISKVV